MTPLPDPEVEIRRLRRKLRDAREDIRLLRTQLAARPPVQDPWEGMTPAEIRHLHAQFTATPTSGPPCADCGKYHPGPCQTCGGLHARKCPRVRSIEYQAQGDRLIIRKVAYWPEGSWDDAGIMWPEDLPPLPEDDQSTPA